MKELSDLILKLRRSGRFVYSYQISEHEKLLPKDQQRAILRKPSGFGKSVAFQILVIIIIYSI